MGGQPNLGSPASGSCQSGRVALGVVPVAGAVAWGDGRHLHLSPASFSAILYLNGDFEGGAFYFTELDAKTETVSSSAP